MLGRPSAATSAILIILALALAVLPFLPESINSPYAIKFLTRVTIIAIMVLSLDLLIGVTGLVSFGHAAFFGLGAYAAFLVTPKFAAGNLLLVLGAATLLSAVAAAIAGFFVVRTRGFYFIMVTMAIGEMLYALFHDTQIAGGSDGATLNFKPLLAVGSIKVIDFSNRYTLYFTALILLAATYLFALWLVRTRFGRVLQAIRWNETRAQALGFDTFRYKLAIYTIAGAIAGLAGALFASIDGFVPPDLLGWRESGLAIMMVVLGGVGSLHGAILGTLAYSVLEEVLKDRHFVGSTVADHWAIAMGLVLIVLVLTAPRGIAGWLPSRRATGRTPKAEASAHEEAQAGPLPVLSAQALTKTFGGLTAVDNVTLSFAPNKIHAIIGPNGAGKTTLTNLLSGAFPASTGSISIGKQDITALPSHRKARYGIGRSFQRTNIFPAFTVRENCELSAQAHEPGLLSRAPGNEDAAVAFAQQATGLIETAGRIARVLCHGEQR
ncbi:MAG: ATP-binding cassette domain-containing protein, partial [Beijerinckiaceae bacterium]